MRENLQLELVFRTEEKVVFMFLQNDYINSSEGNALKIINWRLMQTYITPVKLNTYNKYLTIVLNVEKLEEHLFTVCGSVM